MEGRDPYLVLGVSHTANDQAIRAAYRKLSLQHHPDKNPDDPSSDERFKKVAWAYSVLNDPEKRAQFDRTGAVEGDQDPSAAFNIDKRFAGADFDLFFNTSDVGGVSASPDNGPLGGRAGGVPGRASGSVVFDGTIGDMQSPDSEENSAKEVMKASGQAQVQVRVTTRELFTGGTRVVQVNQWVICGECGGSGRQAMKARPTCQACFGGDPDCVSCGGSIEAFMMHSLGTSTVPCDACASQGRVRCRLKQAIRIPAGVPDGMMVEVAAKAGPPVRVCFVVDMPMHLARRGEELCLTLSLSVGEVLSGMRRKLRLPGGSVHEIALPGVVGLGARWRVAGAGLPVFRSGDGVCGDLVLNIVAKWPTKAWGKAQYAKEGGLASERTVREPLGVSAVTRVQEERWLQVIRASRV